VHAKLELADRDFAPCREHPLLAEAATAVRAGLASGRIELGLHPDFEERRTDGPWQTLSAMWCITMFTPDKAVYHAEHLHLGIRDTPDSTAVS